MAFTFGDSDFSSIFGGMTSPMGASPSMGRLLQQTPEAIIPALIAAGVEPPQDQSAEPEGQLHSAPPIPMMPGAQPPAMPPTTDPLLPQSTPLLGQAYPPMPQFSGPPTTPRVPTMGEFFHPAAPPVVPSAAPNPNAPEPMAPGANAPADWYDSPPAEQPAPGIPLPPSRPDNLGTAVSAKSGGGGGGKAAGSKAATDDAAKKLTDALSGVRAPAAPPQPQLRPEVARAGSSGGGNQNNPLVALLTALLAGGGGQGGAAPYRLNQAVGGKVV